MSNKKLTRSEIKKQLLNQEPLIDDETAFLRHLAHKNKREKALMIHEWLQKKNNWKYKKYPNHYDENKLDKLKKQGLNCEDTIEEHDRFRIERCDEKYYKFNDYQMHETEIRIPEALLYIMKDKLNELDNEVNRLESMNNKLAKILIKQFDFTEEDIREAISCLHRELNEL